jgi:putative FmdB family regulatory protein
MPTYGYRCSACQLEFDVWQKMTDPPQSDCPTCGAEGKRVFYPAGVVFKGSGFYASDTRSPAPAETPTPSPEKKTETKTEPTNKAQSKESTP